MPLIVLSLFDNLAKTPILCAWINPCVLSFYHIVVICLVHMDTMLLSIWYFFASWSIYILLVFLCSLDCWLPKVRNLIFISLFMYTALILVLWYGLTAFIANAVHQSLQKRHRQDKLCNICIMSCMILQRC